MSEINPRRDEHGEPVCSGDACPSSEVSNGYYICSIQSEPKCDRKSRKVVLANVCEPCIPGLRRQRDEGRVELIDLIRELYDEDACVYDHNDYCQTHYYNRPCAHERARAVLASTDTKGELVHARAPKE